jgi:glutaminase
MESYDALEVAVRVSGQKQQAEDSVVQKTPSVIHFNSDEQLSAESLPTPRQALINSWAVGADSPRAAATAKTLPASTPASTNASRMPSDVDKLIQTLVN